jgi:hypothetical protein
MNTPFKLAAAVSLAASLTAFADVKVNDNFSVNGYAVGSWTTTDPDAGKRNETFFKNGTLFGNTDAVKAGVLGKSGPVSGYASILYAPAAGSTNEAGLLDAYVTFEHLPAVQLQIGQFNTPFGLEREISTTRLEVIDRTDLSERTSPLRDIGVMAFNAEPFWGWLSYQAAVTNAIQHELHAESTPEQMVSAHPDLTTGELKWPLEE